jgi:hypothetical protein
MAAPTWDGEHGMMEVHARRLVGSVLAPGDVVIFVFGTGEGARTRTDPVTCTGTTVNLSTVVRVRLAPKARTLNAELHLIIGDNKTRIIGKGTLNLQGGLIPRMSGGRTAKESFELKGTRDKVAVKHSLEVELSLFASDGDGAGGGRADEMVNVQRIRMAMKRSELKQRLRQRVETLASVYTGATKRRLGERQMEVGLLRGYNLPELPPGAAPTGGALVRVISGAHGTLSRVISGTRHPPFAQTLQIKAAGEVSFVLEDRGGEVAGALPVKYADEPMPIKFLKAGASYLCDLKFGDSGPRLLTVLLPQWTLQEKMDQLAEDETVQHLEITTSPFLNNIPVVARYRLLTESDDILADWRESDEHDAELEPFPIRLSRGEMDEDAFNEIREKEEEEAADGVVHQLAVLPATSSIQPNAPPARAIGFTSRGLGSKYLLVELFVPEVPEVDDDGREGEADDTPGIVFVGACMVELKDVANLKETRISKKKDPYKDQDALCYRELKLNADLRVSEDGLEALPPGTQVKNLEMTLRLWDSAVLGRELAKGAGAETAQLNGFDTWLAQLKLVMVEELVLSQNLEAIRSRAYHLQPQQSDRVLPEIETKIYTTYDSSGTAVPEAQLAFSHSVPSTPRLPRIRDARPARRPRTQDHGVVRRKGRPEVPTRPVTPITFTQREVDSAVARAVSETSTRLQNRAEKERREMMDRIDVLSSAIKAHTGEKERFQMELDERSEAIRKCGVEIMHLRNHTKQLTADKSALQDALNEKEAIHEQMLAVDDQIEMLDRGDLEHRLKLLSASYKEEKGKAQDLLARMKHMHGELMRMDELSRAHAALQEAHAAQNVKIQELQEKKKKLSKYVDTVQQQEQVIEKLEEMMEKALGEAREAKNLRAERDSLQADLKQARADLSRNRKGEEVGGLRRTESIGGRPEVGGVRRTASIGAQNDKESPELAALQRKVEEQAKALAAAANAGRSGSQDPAAPSEGALQVAKCLCGCLSVCTWVGG